MEELNESKTPEVLESRAAVEEFEIAEVSLKNAAAQKQNNKKPIDWLKVGIAGTLACSVMSLGLSCAALIKKSNNNQNNNDKSTNVNYGESFTVSTDGYLVIDGVKTDVKIGSTSDIIDAEIKNVDKWGISTYIKFTFDDGSYMTTTPREQVLNDHYYDAASADDLQALVAYGAPKVRLTSHVNLTSALELDSNLEVDLNNKTIMYTATAPIDVKEGVALRLANGNVTFNTPKAMRFSEASSLEIVDANISAQGIIAEVAGDDVKVEILESSIESTGKVVNITNSANNFDLNVEDSNLETADAGNVFVSTEADLLSAIADANVTSITLSTNVTLTDTINLNKDLAIDLNGKTITSTKKAFNIVDGEVSIDNGTINVAGAHSLYVDGTATGSDITLTLGEDLVVNSDNCAIFIKGAGAKLVTAATLTSTGPYATLSGNGNKGNEVDSITIIGGSITHASTMAIYVPQTGKFNITGGTITGTTALYVKSGIVNISGGALTGTGEYTGYVYSQNGAHFFGDALIIDACDYPGGNPVVTITGGTFTSTNAHGIGYYAFEDNTATITAAGYDIYKTTCVSTEAALVSAIADTTVSVVTLTKNITLTNTVNIARDVVINLNGKTVTSSTKAFNIVDGEVSIDNGTITVAGAHSLYVDGTATGSDITLTLGEDLVVNSDNCAIFIKGAGAKLVTAATLTSTGPYATLSGNGNKGNEVDSITIIGGSITHASTMAIYVPQTGKFNITGGTITGTTALYVKSGIVNISGGTFTGTGEYTGYVYSGDGAKFFGDALIIDACGYPGGNPVVTITGGTFTTTDTAAHGIGYYTYGQNTAQISAEGYEVYTENN